MTKQASQMMSNDQLQRIVRTIVLHDVSPQMKLQTARKPVETYRHVLDTLTLNFKGQFEPRTAERMIFSEILE